MQAIRGLAETLLCRAVAALGGLLGRLPGGTSPRAAGMGPLMRSAVAASWQVWLDQEPSASQNQALDELLQLTPQTIREQGEALLDELHDSLDLQIRSHILDYLAALPAHLSRSLPQAQAPGRSALGSLAHVDWLNDLLPSEIPPYAVPCNLPGTTYRLEELAGTGGFGTVYRGHDTRMPYLPLALKFCRDASAIPSLRRERDNLERLLQTRAADWSPRVVRLCGYDLEHPTPYLVYEWVSGGDLASLVWGQAKPVTADRVLEWIRGIAEGLAFAHARGLVHRDLKPGNVLIGAEGVKITDFGIGGTARTESGSVTRSLLRGAGTPMYMAPEQRRGAAPDPRHDLYSLGVIWYQLLLGDLTAEIHPGWEADLRERRTAPEEHLGWIGQCVGPLAQRPGDAGQLLAHLEGSPVPTTLIDELQSLHRLHREVAAVVPTWASRLLATAGGILSWWGYTAVGMGVLIPLLESNRAYRDLLALCVMALALTAMYLGYRAGQWMHGRALKSRRAPLQRRIESQADLLLGLFPQVVAGWGGRAALLDPEQTEQILHRLQAEARLGNPLRRPDFLPRAAPARTEVSPQPNPALNQELFRQYREAIRAVRAAQPAPKWVKAVTTFIAVYSALIALGLTIALPVVFIALYGGVWDRALWIPVVSILGLCLSAGISYTLSRWFYTSQRRRRLAGPLRMLTAGATLLERAFPQEVRSTGGLERLLDGETAPQAVADLETRIAVRGP